MTLAPLRATAQTDNRFAIGAELTIRTSDHASQEDAAHGQFGPGLLWRFGNGRPGWGFHWGLNWYAVDIDRPIGGQMTELGELRLRPFMGGYGYTYRVTRRLNVSANVLGGYALGRSHSPRQALTPISSGWVRDRSAPAPRIRLC